MRLVDDEAVIQQIQAWFEESEELYVNIYQPHGGSSGINYLVRSYSAFRSLVDMARSGVIFFILRELQYPLRGIVDEGFITLAMQFIRDGEDFCVVDEEPAPAPLWYYGSGNTHVELLQHLEECRGIHVCVGKEPNLPIEYWLATDYPNILIATKQEVKI